MTRLIGGLKLPHLLLSALVVLAVGLGIYFVRSARSEANRAAAAERAAVARVATLEQSRAATDTQYVRDTVYQARTLTNYVRVREAVRARPETIPVPRYIVDTLIIRADSAIRACQLTVLTCERRVALSDSLGTARLALLRIDMQRAANARASRGFKRGLVVGVVGTVGAAVALRQVTR